VRLASYTHTDMHLFLRFFDRESATFLFLIRLICFRWLNLSLVFIVVSGNCTTSVYSFFLCRIDCLACFLILWIMYVASSSGFKLKKNRKSCLSHYVYASVEDPVERSILDVEMEIRRRGTVRRFTDQPLAHRF
jgi:hypothetical protein